MLRLLKLTLFRVLVKSLLQKTVIILSILLLLYIIKDLQIILANDSVVQKGIDKIDLFRFFLFSIPDIFLTLLPLSFSAALLWTTLKLRNTSYHKYLNLHGESNERFLKALAMLYLPFALILFGTQQLITKKNKLIADIIYEDLLLRRPLLKAKFSFNLNGLVIAKDGLFFFSKVVFDPSDRKFPVAINVLFFRNSISQKEIILSRSARLEEKAIIFENAKIFNLSLDTLKHQPLKRIKNYSIVIKGFKSPKKQKTSYYSSLNIANLFITIENLATIGVYSPFFWAMIIFQLSNYFLLPFLVLFFTIKIIKVK